MRNDGTIALTTPNAVVLISGTEFFIVYDPDAEITWAGNFHGTVDAASSELEKDLSIPNKQLIAIPEVRGSRFWPLHEHMTPEEFERLVDLLESPIAAADMISGPYLVVESYPNIAVRSGPALGFGILGSLDRGDYECGRNCNYDSDLDEYICGKTLH